MCGIFRLFGSFRGRPSTTWTSGRLFALMSILLFVFTFANLEKHDPKTSSMLNERQRELIGTWKHESAENSDQFLKKIGIGIFLRKIAQLQRPIVRVKHEGSKWHIFIESTFKSHDWSYPINERVLHTTIDGRRFWCTTTLDEDGTQTDVQERTEDEPNNIPSIAKRFVENGKFVLTEECDGVTSRRTFSRVEE